MVTLAIELWPVHSHVCLHERSICKQLAQDAALLQASGVMDYSLLLGELADAFIFPLCDLVLHLSMHSFRFGKHWGSL